MQHTLTEWQQGLLWGLATVPVLRAVITIGGILFRTIQGTYVIMSIGFPPGYSRLWLLVFTPKVAWDVFRDQVCAWANGWEVTYERR